MKTQGVSNSLATGPSQQNAPPQNKKKSDLALKVARVAEATLLAGLVYWMLGSQSLSSVASNTAFTPFSKDEMCVHDLSGRFAERYPFEMRYLSETVLKDRSLNPAMQSSDFAKITSALQSKMQSNELDPQFCLNFAEDFLEKFKTESHRLRWRVEELEKVRPKQDIFSLSIFYQERQQNNLKRALECLEYAGKRNIARAWVVLGKVFEKWVQNPKNGGAYYFDYWSMQADFKVYQRIYLSQNQSAECLDIYSTTFCSPLAGNDAAYQAYENAAKLGDVSGAWAGVELARLENKEGFPKGILSQNELKFLQLAIDCCCDSNAMISMIQWYEVLGKDREAAGRYWKLWENRSSCTPKNGSESINHTRSS
jgi:hypothetical protein